MHGLLLWLFLSLSSNAPNPSQLLDTCLFLPAHSNVHALSSPLTLSSLVWRCMCMVSFQVVVLFFFCFCCFLFVLFWRERNINLLFHLFMHLFVDSCMRPDWRSIHHIGILGWCPNPLNYPARASELFFNFIVSLPNLHYLAILVLELYKLYLSWASGFPVRSAGVGGSNLRSEAGGLAS